MSGPQAGGGVQAAAGPLAGTGRIADDLYLMAHDENTGRPLIGPRLLGTGLAAALLAELMLAAAWSCTQQRRRRHGDQRDGDGLPRRDRR